MRRAAAVLVLGLAALAVPPGPARATLPDQIAWWYAPKDGPVPELVAGPPDAPADGLYLAEGPASGTSASSPVAISAVRFSGKPGAPSSLTLKAADGSTFVGTDVRACPAIDRWAPPPVAPGSWPTRAKYSCDIAMAFGIASSDGASMSWPLGANFEFFSGSGVYDVVLVPFGPVPFRVAVAKPGADAVDIEEPPLPSTSSEVSEPPPLPVAAEVPLDQPLLTLVPPASPDSPPPALALAPPAQAPVPLSTRPARTTDDRGARIAAFLVLAGMTVAMFWLGSQPGRPARTLGALQADAVPAAAAVRGIGRFARQRTTRPRRL